MVARLAHLLLILALLTAQAVCAWGIGVDPCCSDDDAMHAAAISHIDSDEPDHEGTLEHAIHTGHCHCVWEEAVEITVIPPPAEPPAWYEPRQDSPAVEPRGIEWPPRACA